MLLNCFHSAIEHAGQPWTLTQGLSSLTCRNTASFKRHLACFWVVHKTQQALHTAQTKSLRVTDTVTIHHNYPSEPLPVVSCAALFQPALNGQGMVPVVKSTLAEVLEGSHSVL
jgi:hypothetical protein